MKSFVLIIFALVSVNAFVNNLGNIQTFSWDSCASGNDPLVLKTLSLSPDPIVLGQDVTLAFSGTIGTTVSQANLLVTLEKQIFGVWTEIPCVDGLGSCTYDDACALLTPDGPFCQPPFSTYKLPCQCPFQPGSYALPASQIPTQNPNIGWLTSGNFYVKAQITDTSGNELACYEVYFSIQ